MEIDAIVQAIDAEIDLLGKVRALLTDHTAPLKRGLPRPGSGRCSEASEGECGRTSENGSCTKGEMGEDKERLTHMVAPTQKGRHALMMIGASLFFASGIWDLNRRFGRHRIPSPWSITMGMIGSTLMVLSLTQK